MDIERLVERLVEETRLLRDPNHAGGCRHRDHRGHLKSLVLEQSGQGYPVHVGEHDIDKKEVGAHVLLPDPCNRKWMTKGENFVALILQHLTQKFSHL